MSKTELQVENRVKLAALTLLAVPSLPVSPYYSNLFFSFYLKIDQNTSLDQRYQEKSGTGKNASPEEGKTSAESNFYLEELEKYTFSV